MREGFPSPEADVQPDYVAIGQERLAAMGVTDTSFGSIGLSAGDPEGKCIGTLAEAVGRHEAVFRTVGLVVGEALSQGKTPEEVAVNHPFFSHYIARDAEGNHFKVDSSEDLKKN